MAITLHKDLTDANLHAPKGFVNAGIGTYPVKTSTNKLRWGGIERIQVGGYVRMTADSHYFKAAFDNYYWTAVDTTDDSATLSALNPLEFIQSAIFIPHAACYITKVRLWVRVTSGETMNIRLFKANTALVNDSSADINVTKMGSDMSVTSDHNFKSYLVENTYTSTTGALVANQPTLLTCSGYDGTQQFNYMTGFVEVVYT